LEQKIEVPIAAAVKHPILHLEFVHDRQEHALEDGERFGFGVEAPLVHLLDVYVLVDWKFSWTDRQRWLINEELGGCGQGMD